VNQGWKVTLATLGHERSSAAGLTFIEWQYLMKVAQGTQLDGHPALRDGRVREKLAECWLNTFGVRLMTYRSQTELGLGVIPGPEESWAKMVVAGQGQRSAIAAMDMMGPGAASRPRISGHCGITSRTVGIGVPPSVSPAGLMKFFVTSLRNVFSGCLRRSASTEMFLLTC